MSVKCDLSHIGESTDCGCLRTGCWGILRT